MTYSTADYTGDGSTTVFAVPFALTRRNEIRVSINGIDLLTSDFTLNANATTVTCLVAPVVGARVKVYRVTDLDDADRPVDFANGSNIRAQSLDKAVLHLLHGLQEATDKALDGLREVPTDPTKWEGEGKELTDIGAPVGLDSAVRLRDLQSIQQVAGNLPVVSEANENASLFVAGGAWGVRTPLQAAAHLGLKKGAFADYGTGARELVILDNSARIPAIDGRNLTNLNLNASVLAAIAAGGGGGGGGSSTVPTVNLWYTSAVVLNSVSATWNTDSSGALGRLDVSASQPYAEAYNLVPGGGGAKYVDFNVANNITTINVAGKYEVTFEVVLGNRDVTLSSAVTVMLTDAAGTPLWTSGGSHTLGPRAAGAWAGEKLIVKRTLIIDYLAAGTLTVKAVHNSNGGAVWCAGDGTQLTIRKIG